MDKFIERWSFNVRRALSESLPALAEDLRSDDLHVSKRAHQKMVEILAWLSPLPAPLSVAERKAKALMKLQDESISESEQIKAVQRALRATGRPKGRPRTDATQHAIRALQIRCTTTKTWNEIASEVRNCPHKRPRRGTFCPKCGDAIRNAAHRLRGFLVMLGEDPKVMEPPEWL